MAKPKINNITGLIILMIVLFMNSCSVFTGSPEETTDIYPNIYPDYIQVTIPSNISPLNFQVKGANRIKAEFIIDGKVQIHIQNTDQIKIPQKKWHSLLSRNLGKTLHVQVSVWDNEHPKGIQYKAFPIYISNDSIDKNLVYRLIEPGYEGWNLIEIRQRDITSFEERTVFTNRLLDNGCINCHSFQNYSAKDMMLHVRENKNGTVIVKNNQPEVIHLEELGPKKSGTYPMWHPSGDYIIFSSNTTRQAFHAFGDQPLEVYDLESDLILYDVHKKQVLSDSRFASPQHLETFPAWSPKGDKLYFCAAEKKDMPMQKDSLWYSIYAVGFNKQTGTFASKIDTLYNGSAHKKSASFPRISPNGKFLLFTESDFATFPIWHKEAELKMINLTNDSIMNTDALNSPQSESYHSWSSNGKWIIFSSRRLDGLYTHLYLAHCDDEGIWSKPFALPQYNPNSNFERMKSYNIPEFTNEEIEINTKAIENLF